MQSNPFSKLTSTEATLISEYGIESGPKDKTHVLKNSLERHEFQLEIQIEQFIFFLL